MTKLLSISISFLCLLLIALPTSLPGQSDSILYQLQPGGLSPNAHFGTSIASSVDLLIIGAPSIEKPGGAKGRVYIYKQKQSTWVLDTMLEASDGHTRDGFGTSVALQGEYLLVGAPYRNEKNWMSGAAYIFKHSGSAWSENAKLIPNDPIITNEHFGHAVSITDDWFIVSAPRKTIQGRHFAGAVYIFGRNETRVIQKLISGTPKTNERFGSALSANDNWLAVGVPYDKSNAQKTGEVCLFQREGIQWNTIGKKIKAPDAIQNGLFGWDVALGSLTMVISSKRGVYYYEYEDEEWKYDTLLLSRAGFANLKSGFSLSLSSKMVAGGDPANNVVFLFESMDKGWVLKNSFSPEPSQSMRQFGQEVHISNNWIVVGAPEAKTPYKNSGIAFVGQIRPSEEDTPNTDGQDDNIQIEIPEIVVEDIPGIKLDMNFAGITDFHQSVDFLFAGENPIQMGVSAGTIEPERVAVLRGKVLDKSGTPLPGVRISILNRPEFGWTESRENGLFDLAVNGGGVMNIRYSKVGHIRVQRQVRTFWKDYVWLPDVCLIPFDNTVTTIKLANSNNHQIVSGSEVEDKDGKRIPSIVFPPSVKAQMVLPDGSFRHLDTLSLRVTEFTIGENGPEAMPGELPGNTFYTYAAEISVDEAETLGAKTVQFDQPLFYYLDNFLEFSVGTVVPSFFFDRGKGVWVPSDDGVTVRLLDSNNDGVVDALDNNDDGLPDDLDGDGDLSSEVAGLNDTARFKPDTTYWRVPIRHFSSIDLNWPVGSAPSPPAPPSPSGGPPGPYCSQPGSIIEPEIQAMGESLDVTGTSLTLNYRSDRVPGNLLKYDIKIPLSKDSLVSSVKRIGLEILIAGRRFQQTFDPAPNLTARFTWDGKDAYGRTVRGAFPATIRLSYFHEMFYGGRGATMSSSVLARRLVPATAESKFNLGAWNAQGNGLGSWTLSAHHVYDPVNKILHRGDGRDRPVQPIGPVIDKYAGTFASNPSFNGDKLPTEETNIAGPTDIEVDEKGIVYFSEKYRIRKIDENGIVHVIAGTGGSGFSGDGGPATNATFRDIQGFDVGPDGSIYIADAGNHNIRVVTPDSTINTFAGTETAGSTGDGGPAISANLNFPTEVEVSPDGSVYILDLKNFKIRKVTSDGIIHTIAGSGINGYRGDGGPAVDARLGFNANITFPAEDIALDDIGNLYVSTSNRIRKINKEGIITTFVGGTGNTLFNGDGIPAIQANLGSPAGINFDNRGNLYICDEAHSRLRKVRTDGIIETAGGSGMYGFSGDGSLATSAQLSAPYKVAVSPDGKVYMKEWGKNGIRAITPIAPIESGIFLAIPSEDGSEVYLFDEFNRHIVTQHALTSGALDSLVYSSRDGMLEKIVDGYGNTTTITRDTAQKLVIITSPYGKTTTLQLDENSYAKWFINPRSDTIKVTYEDSKPGLLNQYRDANGNVFTYEYDKLGQLIRYRNHESGNYNQIEKTELDDGYIVTFTSAEGRVNTYQFSEEGESIKRINTFPDLSMAVMYIFPDGSNKSTFSDGTSLTQKFHTDPRWGMLAPTPVSQVEDSNGTVINTSIVRRQANVDPTNPLSLISQTQTQEINGNVFLSKFDRTSLTSTELSPEGIEQSVKLNKNGQVIESSSCCQAKVVNAFSATGQLDTFSLVSSNENRKTVFDYHRDGENQGLLYQITNAIGEKTRFEQYNSHGNLELISLPDKHLIKLQYDKNNNIAAITPPGKPRHLFEYNEFNLLKRYLPPPINGDSLFATEYEYNADRELDLVKRPDGKIIDYVYENNIDRLDSIVVYENGIKKSFRAYKYYKESDSPPGALKSITTEDGNNIEYRYKNGLLTQTHWSGAVTGSYEVEYDNNFRIQREIINGDYSVEFEYDKDGLMTRAGEMTIMRRHPSNSTFNNGLIYGTQLNNVVTSLDYNDFGELKDYSVSFIQPHDTTILFEVHYQRDKLGRIVEKIESSIIPGTSTLETESFIYSYDERGRLKQVMQNAYLKDTFKYDAHGNRLLYKSDGSKNVNYDEQDRLLQYDGLTFTYNRNGDLLTQMRNNQTTNFNYDAFGNLKSVKLQDGQNLEYLVDGQNRRIGKKVDGLLTRAFLYKDQLNPIAELDSNGNILNRFVYATKVHAPDYLIRNNNVYRIISDHLGSVRMVVDATSGVLVQKIDYKEFGEMIDNSSPAFQSIGFAGGLYDYSLSLTRYGARDYDPIIARWLSKDPIFFDDDTNLYSYVSNDPVNFIDLTGKERFIGFCSSNIESSLPRCNFTQKCTSKEERVNGQERIIFSMGCNNVNKGKKKTTLKIKAGKIWNSILIFFGQDENYWLLQKKNKANCAAIRG